MQFRAKAVGETGSDIGTFWRMRLADDIARCALWSGPDGWEVRLLVEGVVQRAERCERGDAAFALADGWKRRMTDGGWHPIVPLRLVR